jgi:integrase
MAAEACEVAREDSVAELEREAFWDWALLELLVQSGLRLEEACQLTTLDVLRRHQPDGSVYYLLHVKPSKFDRPRVVPIGDGLGRVIAEIVAHVRRFYRTREVPGCDNWDHHERRPLPRGPYLLQGASARRRLRPSTCAPASPGSRERPAPARATARRWCCARTTAGESSPPSTSLGGVHLESRRM